VLWRRYLDITKNICSVDSTVPTLSGEFFSDLVGHQLYPAKPGNTRKTVVHVFCEASVVNVERDGNLYAQDYHMP